MEEPFIGTIIMTANTRVPKGWALCDGRTLPINQYQALYSLVGTTFGGDGQTTFALPNLIGRVAVGTGQGAGLSAYPLGQKGGAEVSSAKAVQVPVNAAQGAKTTPLPNNRSYDNRSPWLAVNYIIALEGLYPQQDGGGGWSEEMIGEIILWPIRWAPDGWLICDGRTLQIQQYQPLFAILGTTYGGDGRTNFNLPDLRGRAPLHRSQAPGQSAYQIGQRGGDEKGAPAGQKITVAGAADAKTVAVGGADAYDSRQPYLALNYIMCTQGLWPAQP